MLVPWSSSRHFEINFFVHTGVERIGRYSGFYEERAGAMDGKRSR